MNPSCVDVSETKVPAPDVSSSYIHWGGYPATLAALDGFTELRSTDPSIAAMFDKLDMLDRAPQDGVVDAMIQCGFKPSEVSKINSPLFDAIWQGVTGRDPDGQSELEPLKDSLSRVTVRLMIPRPYYEALRWFLTKPSPSHLTFDVGPELCLAAAIGLNDVVRTMLSYRGSSESQAINHSVLPALERAVMNGGVNAAHEIISPMSTELRQSASHLEPLLLAAENGRLDMVKYLLQPSCTDLIKGPRFDEVLCPAIKGHHLSTVDLLMECCSDQLTPGVLSAALRSAIGSGSMEMVNRITAVAQSRGVQVTPCLRDVMPLVKSNNMVSLRLMLPLCGPDRSFSHVLLRSACEYADIEIVRLLFDTRMVDLRSAIHMQDWKPVRRGDGAIALYLLEQLGMQIWMDQWVWIAVVLGETDMVQSLLAFLAAHSPARAAQLQAEVDQNDLVRMWGKLDGPAAERLDAAVQAAALGRTDLVRVGTSMFIVDDDDRFQMCAAAVKGGHIDCARLLTRMIDDRWTFDLLESAATVPDPAMIRLVMDELLTVVTQRQLASSDSDLLVPLFRPIHVAAVRSHMEHVSMLLEWLIERDGAHRVIVPSLTAAMAGGESAAHRCVAVAAVTIHELISLHFDRMVDRSLVAAVKSGSIAMVELHLNAGANVRHNGNEALRLAESQGHAAMVELLKARCAGSD